MCFSDAHKSYVQKPELESEIAIVLVSLVLFE